MTLCRTLHIHLSSFLLISTLKTRPRKCKLLAQFTPWGEGVGICRWIYLTSKPVLSNFNCTFYPCLVGPDHITFPFLCVLPHSSSLRLSYKLLSLLRALFSALHMLEVFIHSDFSFSFSKVPFLKPALLTTKASYFIASVALTTI